MVMVIGMILVIMNLVVLFVGLKKIVEKKVELEVVGIVIFVDMDDEVFVIMFGMGLIKLCSGKEMEVICVVNFLINNDDGGVVWIKFNVVFVKEGEEGGCGCCGGGCCCCV